MNKEELLKKIATTMSEAEGLAVEEQLERSAMLMADVLREMLEIEVEMGSFFLAQLIMQTMRSMGPDCIEFIEQMKPEIVATVKRLRELQEKEMTI